MTNHQDKERSSDSKEAFQQWCNEHTEYRFWNSTDIAESAWIAGRKSALAASPQLPVAEQPAGQEDEPLITVEASLRFKLEHEKSEREYYENECKRLRSQLSAAPHSPVAQMSGDDEELPIEPNMTKDDALRLSVKTLRALQCGDDSTWPLIGNIIAEVEQAITSFLPASHPSNAVQEAPITDEERDAFYAQKRFGEMSDDASVKAWVIAHRKPAATVPQVVQAPDGYMCFGRDGDAFGYSPKSQPMKGLDWEPVYRNAAPQPVAAPIMPSDVDALRLAKECGISCTSAQAYSFRRALLTTASNAGEAKQGEES